MSPEIIQYKTTPQTDLNIHIFPPGEGGNRPALLLFFCGGWGGFDATKVYPQATYFASRGMVCFCVEVRVRQHGTTPAECVTDAKSAMRWVRGHAEEYGVDPDKVAVFGSSAAGHVSACLGTVQGFDDPEDDTSMSVVPNASVLCCPVTVVYHNQRRVELFGGPERARKLSPIYNVKPGVPPALVLVGEADTSVVPEEGMLFKRAMEKAGNRCECIKYRGEGHGFMGWFDGNNPMFFIGFREADRFLASLGFLEGEPTIDDFDYEGPGAEK